jgi:hypothetical protein
VDRDSGGDTDRRGGVGRGRVNAVVVRGEEARVGVECDAGENDSVGIVIVIEGEADVDVEGERR